MKVNHRTLKDNELKKLIFANDKQVYVGKLKRLKFLLTQENYNVFPAPALAIEYYEEARLCWYVGAFVASICMVQLAFEELLRSYYRSARGIKGRLKCSNSKKVDNATFYELLEEAREDGLISDKEKQELNHLRKNIRNPYVHVKDVKIENGKQNLQKPDFFTQYLKIKAPEVIGTDVEDEARFAIKVLVTMFSKISIRMWG